MSRATITITSEKDGSVKVSQEYEPSITDGMTGSDHPAASVALRMLQLWTEYNASDAEDEEDDE